MTLLAARIRRLLDARTADTGKCEGIGVVVPGMVDPGTGRVLHAPTLGWRNVELRARLAAATGLPVHVENSGRACALAQVWEARTGAAPVRNLVFVSVSDGVGVGSRRQRRAAARPAQHRRRVRAHAAQHRRSALLVRRHRMLGSAHLESRDADTLLRPRAGTDGARPIRPFTIDDLIARARDRRRAKPSRRCRRRRAISVSASAPSSTSSIPTASSSAEKSRPPGTSSRARFARRWPSARSRRRRRRPISSSFQLKNIRACAAPPCSSRRRRLPRQSWPDQGAVMSARRFLCWTLAAVAFLALLVTTSGPRADADRDDPRQRQGRPGRRGSGRHGHRHQPGHAVLQRRCDRRRRRVRAASPADRQLQGRRHPCRLQDLLADRHRPRGRAQRQSRRDASSSAR